MSTHAPCLPRSARHSTDAGTGLITSLVRPINRTLERMAERRCINRSMAELNALDEAMLRDIGLDRQEIEYLALQRLAGQRWLR